MPIQSVVILESEDPTTASIHRPTPQQTAEPLRGMISVNVVRQMTEPPTLKSSKETQIPSTPHGEFATVVIQDNNQPVEKEKCQSEVLPTPEPNRGVMAVGISSLTGTKLPKTNRSKETKIPPQPQRGVSHVWIKDS
jgi:hypothetical protein